MSSVTVSVIQPTYDRTGAVELLARAAVMSVRALETSVGRRRSGARDALGPARLPDRVSSSRAA